MKVAIWDTNVLRQDGKIMHFDILVPEKLKDIDIILAYGTAYIKTKSFKTKRLTADECTFCHLEDVDKETKQALFKQVEETGYAIVELQNCD